MDDKQKVFEHEIIDRLARIEVKVDDVKTIRENSEQAQADANRALAMSKENKNDIAEMKANTKWIWGIIATLAISLVMFLVNKL